MTNKNKIIDRVRGNQEEEMGKEVGHVIDKNILPTCMKK